MDAKSKKVLILGGGFGGVKAALELADSPAFDITLISDQENFRYYPTLYRAATGGSQRASSIPLAEIFKGKPVQTIHSSAKHIDRDKKLVSSSSGKKYPYDILVVSLGVVTNYFGIKGLKEYSFGIKTLQEAYELRDHLHEHLVDNQKPDVNYVIIGGGPTGVELAGALPGYIRHIMKKHGIKEKAVHVDLVEAAPRLMPRMPKPYSHAVAKRLRKLGVHLLLGQTVLAQKADEIMISGHDIDSHTVVWTAGVTNHPFLQDNKFALNEHGKAVVDQYLQSEPGIYVIGDNADTPYSGMAQTALYDGIYLGKHLKQLADDKPPLTYKPKKPIYVTPVGPSWAAVLWGNTQIYGWFGWFLRTAADWIGYHDLEPVIPASKHLLAQTAEQESCPECFDTHKASA